MRSVGIQLCIVRHCHHRANGNTIPDPACGNRSRPRCSRHLASAGDRGTAAAVARKFFHCRICRDQFNIVSRFTNEPQLMVGSNQSSCAGLDFQPHGSSRMHLHRSFETCPKLPLSLARRSQIQTIPQLKRRSESVPARNEQVDNPQSRHWFGRYCKLNRFGFLGPTRVVNLGVSSPKTSALVSSVFATTCTAQSKRVLCFNNYEGGTVQVWTNSRCTICVRENYVDGQCVTTTANQFANPPTGNGIRSREQIPD